MKRTKLIFLLIIIILTLVACSPIEAHEKVAEVNPSPSPSPKTCTTIKVNEAMLAFTYDMTKEEVIDLIGVEPSEDYVKRIFYFDQDFLNIPANVSFTFNENVLSEILIGLDLIYPYDIKNEYIERNLHALIVNFNEDYGYYDEKGYNPDTDFYYYTWEYTKNGTVEIWHWTGEYASIAISFSDTK